MTQPGVQPPGIWQVVRQFGWLTPREFIDGMALGQLTPGPVLMIAAYVGYKVAGVSGAAVAATASFLPSFMIMLAILPVSIASEGSPGFERS